MKQTFFNKVGNLFKRSETVIPKKAESDFTGGTYTPLYVVSYDGEKNLGEIGPVIDYRPNYARLRFRSWQAHTESEVAQTVIKRYITWMIGKGLKLQSEPMVALLKAEGITIDSQKFSEITEARFAAFRKSRACDHAGMRNLDAIAKRAYKNAILGGDVLVVLRYVKKKITVQLIDGAHLKSPVFESQVLPNGNRIEHGIEISPEGKHIRFFVQGKNYKSETIEAEGKTSGMLMAFLVYGLEYRLDSVRGLPLIACVLETLKKLERYKEAVVGSAEEAAKIVYQIVHKEFSTGESALSKQLTQSMNADAKTGDIPVDQQGKELASNVAATTNKQTYNMPVGSEMKGLSTQHELHFKDFYTVNINLVCATLGIPPEVAMSKYDSNFSASRAALKDWEHSLTVGRDEFSNAFYQNIYNFWLEIKILENKIQADGYLTAKRDGDDDVVTAYRNARFVGAAVPHIDPLKEVQAQRLKLGTTGAALPLTTHEAAVEELNGGESDANMEQYAKELDKSKKLKIVVEPLKKQGGPNN